MVSGRNPPRWALGCYWRTDGEPIWKNEQLIAADDAASSHTETEADAFIKRLAERLGVDGRHVTAGYEDSFYYLWKERRLPANVDPRKSNLADAEERERLAAVFERGLGRVVGFALPVRVLSTGGETRWESGPWTFRSEQMFLLPGDSPMGFRLPLDSLLWSADKEKEHLYERDPFAERSPLPSHNAGHTEQEPSRPLRQARQNGSGLAARQRGLARSISNWERSPVTQMAGMLRDPSLPQGPAGTESGLGEEAVDEWGHPNDWQSRPEGRAPDGQPGDGTVVRTALCVEPRQGVLYVFMPPLAHVEEYLDLVSAIEETAAELSLPVKIEGYSPPYDPRLLYFKVTPDPGVIEVNLQPASTWNELVEYTTTLYSEARATRLGTEKFMLDGRHTGTGGGNHIVLGSTKPADSPFLRRPDLLRSLITYWNNRPSLSYLFSGLFIGPTSQAPRADEARHESVYELETALGLLPGAAGTRGSRHGSLDGRSRAAEPAGRRDGEHAPRRNSASTSFTLPTRRPDGWAWWNSAPSRCRPMRMSLAQQLLVRALIARFWKEPYSQRLVRWGTALHDRFVLPHFISQDFAEVLDEMRDAGYPFEQDWFASHFEFRFPLCGEATHRGIHLELRQAIEPWHVLGEEPGGGGTVRVRRHVAGAAASEGPRFDRSAVRRGLQRSTRPASADRHAGGIRGGRSLPGMAASEVPAPHDWRSHAPCL